MLVKGLEWLLSFTLQSRWWIFRIYIDRGSAQRLATDPQCTPSQCTTNINLQFNLVHAAEFQFIIQHISPNNTDCADVVNVIAHSQSTRVDLLQLIFNLVEWIRTKKKESKLRCKFCRKHDFEILCFRFRYSVPFNRLADCTNHTQTWNCVFFSCATSSSLFFSTLFAYIIATFDCQINRMAYNCSL